MYKKILSFISIFILWSCKAPQTPTAYPSNVVSTTQQKTKENHTLLTGADRFETYLPLLKGKTIGVVTNATGILSATNQHIIDFLIENKIAIETIFVPEHGFRGDADAGEIVKDSKDSKTGIPIVSLYGSNKKPKPEHLTGLNYIVFDIQDVGVRFYTYISTLHYVMEACAENNLPLLVLDRPNPNAHIIDGPVLNPQYSSFVGMHPVPILYGMTIGEYALMINGQGWLANQVQCNLTVIECDNYTHHKKYHLPVKPSPNLPNDLAINLYASLCLFEGTQVSVGRGTSTPFQIYGSPYMPISNFSFTPQPTLGAKDPLYKNQLCYGENLADKKVKNLELKWLLKAYQQTQSPNTFFNSFFTKLAGTPVLQKQIEDGFSELEIKKTWQSDLENFKKIRARYLLYP